MTDLFGNIFSENEIIRTLGFYQPFCSLMIHGKIETRWVTDGRKPPFPLGKYLLYSTKASCSNATLFQWCGPELMLHITNTLKEDNTQTIYESALAIGKLKSISPYKKAQEMEGFVLYKGLKYFDGITIPKFQWGLHFENVQAIEPFKWKYGKQGVGFVPDSELSKIKLLCNQ